MNIINGFFWSHVPLLNPQDKDPQRIKNSDRTIAETHDYKNISFPVSIEDYNEIEKQNSIRVNGFGYENKEKFPIYISKEKFEKELNLILITNEKTNHYVLIKDFNRFMYAQTNHKNKRYFCMCCLQCFSIGDILGKYKPNCLSRNGKQMPQEGSTVKSVNYHKQHANTFVIYANFECILKDVQGCKPGNKTSYTTEYQKHKGCSYSFKLVCCYDNTYSKAVQIYRGENVTYKYLEKCYKKSIIAKI